MSESIVKLLKKYLCSTNVAQEEKKDFFVEKLGGGNFLVQVSFVSSAWKNEQTNFGEQKTD